MMLRRWDAARTVLWLTLVNLAAAPLAAQQHEVPPGVQVLQVQAATPAQLDTLVRLEQAHREIEIWSHRLAVGPIEMRITEVLRPLLDEAGLAYEILDSDLKATYDARFAPTRNEPDFFDDYRSYAEHVAFLEELVAAQPDIAELVQIGTSVRGRAMWALRITGPGDVSERPAVMYHGGQHGNEIIGPSSAAYIAWSLIEGYGVDPKITELVDNVEWYVLTIMNPDGYVAGSRFNANGLDLNRNWGGPGSRPDPFSQPETAAMRDFFLANPRVRVHVDMHSFGRMVMWPWGHTPALCEDHGTYQILGDGMADEMIEVRGVDYDRRGPVYTTIYPVTGGSVDYSYGELGLWGFVFEIGTSHSMPPGQIVPSGREMLAAHLYLSQWIYDCNGNGQPDGVDIALGISSDCPANGIPDDCEAAYADCNGDGVSDRCELATGAADVNVNGLLDECELLAPCHETLSVDSGPAGTPQAVALDGDVALVGMPLDAGRVQPYRLEDGGWVAEPLLVTPDGADGDRFGTAIAMSGSTAVICADAHAPAGAAYVYRREGTAWVFDTKLTPSDAGPDSGFGADVAMDGDVIVVGARLADVDGNENGAAYVYRRVAGDWVEEARLSAGNGADGDRFGAAVAVAGNLIVVGVPRDTTQAGGFEAGSARVYRFAGQDWISEQLLRAQDGDGGDRFGSSVSIADNRIAVGAIRDEQLGTNAGAVYIREFDGVSWVETAKLTAAAGATQDLFGWDVMLDGDQLLIGARRVDRAGVTNSGAAYLFEHDGAGWQQLIDMGIPTALPGEGIGSAVALDGGRALLGTRVADAVPPSTSAYLVGVDTLDCNANGVTDSCDVALATSADADESGTPDECECLGDLNSDGMVDLTDLATLITNFGAQGATAEQGDIDGDGAVTLDDLAALLGSYGGNC